MASASRHTAAPVVVQSVEDMVAHRQVLAAQTPLVRVGLVPTMGALHDGHLRLVAAARAQCDLVVASVFVNPRQFAPGEDFDRYPRQLERDVSLLASQGVDLVFAPDREGMYPPGAATHVFVEGMDDRSEGRARPGFFQGVATVCCKLFNIVQPHRAFFGQKDGLQCVVVQQMVRDLNMPVQIEVCPTAREEDGLAMSSRNVYLTQQQRAAAPAVYQALEAVQRAYAAGERSGQQLRSMAQQVIDKEPLMTTQYVSVAERLTGDELEWVEAGPGKGAMVSIAVKFKDGPVRLIDNILLE